MPTSIVKISIASLVGVISVSFAAIFIRLASDVPSITIVTYRMVIAAIILLSISILRKQHKWYISKTTLVYSSIAGLFLCAHFVLWVTSLRYTSISSSTVLVTTNPIFVGIFSYLLFKEKQSKELIFAIMLSIGGSFIIASADGHLFGTVIDSKALLGDILALLGAVCVSGYLMVGYKLRQVVPILPYVTLVYGFSAVFALLLALITHQHFTGYRTNSYIYMILLAVVPQIFGHTSFNWLLEHLKATAVAITILGEPIGASILAYLFFSEVVGWMQLIGIIMIFAAILISTRKGTRGP